MVLVIVCIQLRTPCTFPVETVSPRKRGGNGRVEGGRLKDSLYSVGSNRVNRKMLADFFLRLARVESIVNYY
jgi:hypothetical protein